MCKHLYFKEPCGVPLSIAAGEGHIKTVLRLVEAGATVNYQDKVSMDY